MLFTRTHTADRRAGPRRAGAALLLGLAWVLAAFAIAHAQPGDAVEGRRIPPSDAPTSPPPERPRGPSLLEQFLGQLRVMPKVTGMPLERARTLLLRAGFRDIQANPSPSNLPGDTVTQQSPHAGALVAARPAVVLTVSDGSLVSVPDLTGQSPAEAQKTLGRRLELGAGGEQVSDAQPAGQILSTNPAAGAMVQIGSRVSYVTASDQVSVPDLRGRTPEQAASILADSRLQLGPGQDRFARSAAGQILSTDPPGGARVRPGSQVSYVVSTDRLAVPKVEGLSEADAVSLLDRVGFAHAVQPVGAGAQKVDVVAGQDPGAGTVASLGATVSLTMQQRTPPPVSPASSSPPSSGPPSSGPASSGPASSGPASSAPPAGTTDGSNGATAIGPGPNSGPAPSVRPTMTGSRTPLTVALALAALAASAIAGVIGWSAAWPLRTRVSVAIEGGVRPAAAGPEPAMSAPEMRLQWEVRMEPPVAEEAAATEGELTEKATGA